MSGTGETTVATPPQRIFIYYYYYFYVHATIAHVLVYNINNNIYCRINRRRMVCNNIIIIIIDNDDFIRYHAYIDHCMKRSDPFKFRSYLFSFIVGLVKLYTQIQWIFLTTEACSAIGFSNT